MTIAWKNNLFFKHTGENNPKKSNTASLKKPSAGLYK
jgi:hypothetical protein